MFPPYLSADFRLPISAFAQTAPAQPTTFPKGEVLQFSLENSHVFPGTDLGKSFRPLA